MAPKKKSNNNDKKKNPTKATTTKNPEIKPIQKVNILDAILKHLETQNASVNPDNL